MSRECICIACRLCPPKSPTTPMGKTGIYGDIKHCVWGSPVDYMILPKAGMSVCRRGRQISTCRLKQTERRT